MPPISIREAQERPDLVQSRIALPGVTIELCAFPEVLAETVAVTERHAVLSLGLSRLLAGSEGRAGSDRRTPFVRFGALGFRPAGVSVEMRVAGGACHTIRCRFEDHALGEAPGSAPLSTAQLAACFDIRAPAIEDAMLRLADEAAHPRPDSMSLAAALIAVTLVDLRRYLDEAEQRAARRKGGLAPRRLTRALARIDQPGPPPGIDELAALSGLSRFHFMRCFRETVGISPGAFIQQARITRAKALLAADARPLATIAHDLGYGDAPAFCAAFRRATGRPPGAWRATTLRGELA